MDAGSFGYVFQFHLAPGGPDETAVTPRYCGGYDRAECMDGNPASFGDWWRLFSDPNLAVDPLKKCTTTTGSQIVGHQYIQMNGADYLTRPFTWQASPADADFVHYWKLGTNRWAIQLRIKIAPSSAASPPPISAGIEKGSTFWYEITESATQQYLSIGKYPEPVGATKTGVTTSICVSPQHNNDSLFHQELGSVDPQCPGCDPNKFSKLTDLGASPGDCDTGLTITNIGALFNTPPPYDNVGPLNQIKAVDATNTVHANTMIAQVKNTDPADITGTIQARFRLANWGSGPIGSDTGAFSDIRGGSAVCLPEGGPPCTAQTIPAGQQRAIHFDWTLGNDGTLGASEYCAYGLSPPSGGPCAPCMCDGSQPDCMAGTPGSGVAGKPCMKVHNPHECMFVELSAPNSSVNFVQASAYNNMNFAQMSSVAREALIDARNLPTAPGQQAQDIYFLVVPRNMPSSVPAGTTTTSLIQSAATTRALILSRPYLADIARLQDEDPEKLQAIIDALARQRPGQIVVAAPRSGDAAGSGSSRAKVDDERLAQIASAMRVMPNDDWLSAKNLVALARFSGQGDHPNDDLVHDAVSSLGPSQAAEIVPTLEIYPFYKPPNDVVYQPMSSFALFLSHEQTLGGVRYELDGAAKVAENVYHLRIPVGFARKIQIRAQALVGSEVPLPRGNPAWPCAGGCAACGGVNRNCGLVATIGNTAPGLIAGVFVIRRRRKKQKPARA